MNYSEITNFETWTEMVKAEAMKLYDVRQYLNEKGLARYYAYRDFFLSHDDTGVTVHMFSMDVLDDEDAIDLAVNNADEFADFVFDCIREG